jgi:SAM-dependent methyltransferase
MTADKARFDEARYNDYDGYAQEYAIGTQTSPFNALYERPAVLAAAGDVAGLRVLDAGGGPGVLAAALIARGAAVTGIDLSRALLAIARERLGPGVPLHQADLTQPLDFPDGSFDLIVSSLVMHYLEDWEPTLRELRRVLTTDGRLVFSTHHPFADLRDSGIDDYFGTYAYTEQREWIDQTMMMRFWHRPLRAMLAAFRTSGLVVQDIIEPEPAPELAEANPDAYRHLTRNAQFLLFSLARR